MSAEEILDRIIKECLNQISDHPIGSIRHLVTLDEKHFCPVVRDNDEWQEILEGQVSGLAKSSVEDLVEEAAKDLMS